MTEQQLPEDQEEILPGEIVPLDQVSHTFIGSVVENKLSVSQLMELTKAHRLKENYLENVLVSKEDLANTDLIASIILATARDIIRVKSAKHKLVSN